MRYLRKMVSVYVCRECERESTHDEVRWDGYGEGECPHCEHGVSPVREVPATFWSVGVYTVCSVYGGPEEGGWYYDAGSLDQPRKIRVFEDYEEAEAYQASLLAEIPPEERRGTETRTSVCGFTEELPARSWPSVRPRYC